MKAHSMFSATAFAVTIALAPPRAAAQELTPVSVSAEIVHPDARLRFGARLAEVQTKAAKLFAAYLAPRVGFARFLPDADTLPFRIVFRLSQRDTTSHTQFEDIGFRAEVRKQDAVLGEDFWLLVRAADNTSAGFGSADTFLARLESDLLAHADAELPRKVLRAVPIASEGYLQPSPAGWALRLRPLDLCLLIRDDEQIVVRINHELDEPQHRRRIFDAWISGEFAMGQAPDDVKPYLGGIFLEPTDASRQPLTVSLTTEGKLLVKGVFLVTYRHDPQSCRQRGTP